MQYGTCSRTGAATAIATALPGSAHLRKRRGSMTNTPGATPPRSPHSCGPARSKPIELIDIAMSPIRGETNRRQNSSRFVEVERRPLAEYPRIAGDAR